MGNSVKWKVKVMTNEVAEALYLELAEIRHDLRCLQEHGLALLVNDRMTIVSNFLTAEQKKLVAMHLASEGIA